MKLFRAGMSALLALTMIGTAQPATVRAAAPATPLVLAPAHSAPATKVVYSPVKAPQFSGTGPCFATPDNGITVFDTADASAVQQAVDAAAVNGTVKIAGICAGVQTRAGTTQTVYISKTLTLMGGYTAPNWTTSDANNPTILDASNAGRALYANAAVTMSNFILQKGNGSSGAGGGGYFGSPSVLTGMTFISNTSTSNGGGAAFNAPVVITGGLFLSNTSTSSGGGAWFFSNATVSGTSFVNNTGLQSGGAFFQSPATLTNTRFVSNTGSYYAGGATFFNRATLLNAVFISNTTVYEYGGGAQFNGATNVITGSMFIANRAAYQFGGGGGGIATLGGQTRIFNSVFARNSSATGNGAAMYFNAGPNYVAHTTIASPTLAAGSAIYSTYSTFISNTIVASHTTGVFGSVTSSYNLFFGNTLNGVSIGTGSVTGDPLFLNPSLHDYHIITGSAAINKGANAGVLTDLDGLSRPRGTGFDMGAFEFNNSSPVANAGVPQTVIVGTLVTLAGGSSFDPDGDALTFSWSQVSGTPVTLDNTSAISPAFTAPAITGTLVFQLIVTDTLNQPSAPALVTVTVNLPSVCFATPDNGTTVFGSANADAVQQAVDAAAVNGTVKVAGTCAGVQARAGTTQTVIITKALSLMGGFTDTNWLTIDPIANPTTLDALAQGRVMFTTQPVTVSDVTAQRGNAAVGSGGGAYFGNTAVLTGVAFISSTANEWGGGAAFNDVASLSDGTFQNNVAGANGRGGGAFFNTIATVSGTTFISNSFAALGASTACGTNAACGGGAFFEETATLTGTQFISNAARTGGGAYVVGSANLIDASLTNNTATSLGGGALFNGATILAGTYFTGNTSSTSGGAYFASTATLTDSVFTGNAATSNNAGGAWFVGAATLTGTVFTGNTASQNGGGGYFGNTAVITNASFAGNTSNASTGGGGGAYFFDIGTLAGVSFISNTAADDGGGAYFRSPTTLAGTQFISNAASSSGGGAYAQNVVMLTGGLFQQNRSTGSNGVGGGGLVAFATLVMSGTAFISNTTGNTGGGAYTRNAATLNGGSFIGNSSTLNNGGGLYAFNTLTLTDTQFLSNTSQGSGGGALFFGAVTLNGGLFQNNRVTTLGQGGGFEAWGLLTMTSTQFISNSAPTGGGISHVNAGNARIVNALFTRNRASITNRGMAAYFNSPGSVELIHTTIASPTVATESAIAVFSGTVNITNTLIASHTIGINNAGGTVNENFNLFSGVATPTSGTVNSGGNSITDTASFANAANNNYRLVDGTPGVDDGTDAGITTDFFGNARPLGNGFDIGYAETTPTLADVSIVKTASSASMALNGAITFTLAFSNAGPGTARNIVVRDTLPPSLTLSSWTSSTTGMTLTQSSGAPNLSWRAGDMVPGDHGIITLTAITRNSVNALGTLTNTATIAAGNDVSATNNSDNAVVTIIGTPTAGFSFTPAPAAQNTLFDLFTREYSFNELFFTGIYTLSVPKSQVYIDVALNTQPASTVTLPFSSTNTGEGTVEPASLTFTPANWNMPQRVILSSVDDLYPGTVPVNFPYTKDVPNYTLVVSPAISLDPNYNGLDAPDFAATNIDNEISSNQSAGGMWPNANLAYDEVTYDNRANTTTQRFRFTQGPDAANTFALCGPVVFSGVKQTLTQPNGTVITGSYGSSPLSIIGPYFTNIQTVTGNAEMVIKYPGILPLQTSQLRLRHNSGTIIAPYATSLGCTIYPPAQDLSLIDAPPTGNDDSYAANNTQFLVVAGPQGVLANDTASGEDARYRPLRARLVTPPSAGQVNLMPDGAFVYTPSLGFAGAVTFTYLASQNELTALVTSTVTLNVTNGPLTVTNTHDGGPGSLRWMVASAALRAGANTIGFDAALAGQVITLTSGEIDIAGNVSIDASNLMTPVAVSGNNSSRIFSVTNSSAVTITALVLQNGNAGNGAAIFNSGALNLVNTRLLNNSATNGSAIYQAGGSTQMANSCVVSNSSMAVFYAGGTSPITATGNWWGSASGPGGNGPGTGDSAGSNVNFSSFLTVAPADCPILPEPAVAISKRVTPASTTPGSAITYTLAFSNAGSGIATGIIITDHVPASVTISGVSSSGAPITQTSGTPDFAWQVSDLVAGEGGVITLTGAISPTAAAGIITNTANITASNAVTAANTSASATVVVAINTCFATPDNGTTVFGSANADAVQQAVDAASANGTVKIAGVCAGTQTRAGNAQTVIITKALSLMGGFTTTDWSTYNPAGNPTTLNALAQGRVVSASVAATLMGFTATNGYLASDSPLNGGGIYAASAMTLTDMNVVSNTVINLGANGGDKRGGGAFIAGAALVTNSTFISNTANSQGMADNRGGGGLWVGGTASVTGSTFISNVTYVFGAGAYFDSAATVTNSSFRNNKTTHFLVGGGAGATFNVTSTVAGSTFDGNFVNNGGAGALFNAGAIVSNSTFSNNIADGAGGGILVTGGASITGSTFISNSAYSYGGGAYFAGATAVTGTTFSRNFANVNDGGGAYFVAAAVLDGVSFVTNTSVSSGGGAYFNSLATLNNTQFISNTAQKDGGGAYVNGVSSLTGTSFISNALTGSYSGAGAFFNALTVITGSTFISNVSAGGGGGGAFNAGSTLTNTSFTNNRARTQGGGGIFVPGQVLVGVSFTGNNVTNGSGGGAHFVIGAAMTRTTFTSNTASFNGGGALFLAAATLSGDAAFISNTAANNGGGAYFNNTVAVSGNFTFISNTATSTGGGAFFNAAANLSGLTFAGNRVTAGSGGGASFKATSAITNITFLSNSASSGGGGVYNSAGALRVSASQFVSNSANNGGGMLNDVGGKVTLDASTFTSNTTTGSGNGGAVFNSSGDITITNGSLIRANTTASSGGALLNSAGTMRVLSSTVVSNTAAVGGGGFYNQTNGQLIIDNSDIAFNQSSLGGGIAMIAATSALTITNSHLLSNTGTSNGGAIYQQNGASNITGSCIVGNSSTAVRYIGGTAPITATGNWWGSASGPSGVGPGVGDSVSNNVDFSGFLGAAPTGCPSVLPPDVAISKSVTPASGLAGSAITYTLRFSNTGAGAAGGVVISDSVPASVTISSVSSSGATITQTSGAPDFAWQVSNLAPNAGGIITLSGVVSSVAVAGDVIANTATITAGGDSNAANNSATANFTVTAISVCYATPDNGTTVFGSANANAVQQAVDAAPANGTVKVAGICAGVQVRGGDNQTVYISKTLTLIGGFTNTVGGWVTSDPIANPTTLDAQAGGRVIYATQAVTVSNLTVQRGNTTGNGAGAYFGSIATLTGTTFASNTSSFNAGGAYFASIATLTDTTFTSNTASSNGGGAYFNNTAVLTGTTFASNTSADYSGGGAYFAGSATLTGTTFASNNSDSSGGGAYFNSTTVLSGTTFASNTSSFNAGGAYFASSATLTGTTFTSNTSTGIGGGATFNGTSALNSTSFISNSAGNSGGGAYFSNVATMAGGDIISNTSNNNGGGAYFNNTAVLTATTFASNRSATFNGGGALFANAAILTGTTFAGNTAANFGGGAFFLISAPATITGTTFISNTATNGSGGAHFGSTATLSNTAFISNTAMNGDGGGATFSNIATLADASFSSNRTSNSGGGAFFNSASVLTGTTFTRNTASNAGGAYFFSTATLAGTTFTSNTANLGGGAYFLGTAALTGTVFMSNIANGDGGGARFSAATTLSGATFISNTATRGGGGYFNDTTAMRNAAFIGNTASGASASDGGGGAWFAGTATLTDTAFLTNTANVGGGGAFFAVTAILTGNTFAGNTVNRGTNTNGLGGGAYFLSAATLTANTFTRNAATNAGGGGFFERDASLAGNTFLGNASNFGGGGFFGVNATLTGTTFTENVARTIGGGAYFGDSAALTRTTFTGNMAGFGGGAYFGGLTSASLVNALFARNAISNGFGAALYVSNVSPLNIVHTTIASPTVVGASAIYVNNGTVNLTNTLIASHTVGIERVGGTVNESFTLFSGVATPYSGTITSSGNSITGTAGFVDAANDNYRILNTSAALNAGTNAGVTTDYDGNTRPFGAGFDIGAFEAQANPPVAAVCFVEINGDNATDFSSADAQAVRDGVAAVATGGTVKVAGTCAGAIAQSGTSQVVLITKTLTLIGGYTSTNWLAASDPIANPTKLDALAGGRVISATAAVTISNLTAQNGNTTGNGGGASFGASAVLTGTNFVSNIAMGNGGGASFGASAVLTGTNFVSNNATGNGGGAFVNGVTAVSDATFISNVANLSGGGALFMSSSALTETTFQSNIALQGGAAWFGSTAPAVLMGGAFIGNRAGSVGGAYFGTSVVMSGTMVAGNSTSGGHGGGISAVGVATLTGTLFISNTSNGDGGGARFSTVTTLSGATFISNTASQNGGGVSAMGAMTVTGSTFVSNTASIQAGGALFASTATVTGSTFSANSAGSMSGGATFVDAATLTNTTFTSNTAGSYGGGAVFNNGAASVAGSSFISNSAGINGGGAIFGSAATLAGNTFLSNTAGDSGGGAYFYGNTTLTGTTFTSNRAITNGGGILFMLAPALITNTQFVRNSAGANGGGAALMTSTVQLFNTDFISNVASGAGYVNGGGGVWSNGAIAQTGGTYAGNTSANNGGGLQAAGGYTLTNVSFFNNVAAREGGGTHQFASSGPVPGSVTGGTFSGNRANNGSGGAIYAYANPLVISGTQVLSNTATNSGGGVFNYASTRIINALLQNNNVRAVFSRNALEIAGSQFISNSGGSGGAAFSDGGGVTISDSTFERNDGQGNSGGAVFAGSNQGAAFAIITSSVFLSNSGGSGAAVFVNNGPLNVTSSRFDNSFANSSGGALFTNGSVVVSDSQFLSNTTTGYSSGGAIFAGLALTVTNSRFERHAGGTGGTLFSNGSATILNSTFLTSTSGFATTNPGGALFAQNAITVQDSHFENSSSGGPGGAIFGNGSVMLTNTDFISNSANAIGGAVFGRVNVTGGRFERNAGTGGGAIWGNYGASSVITGATFLSNTANGGSGGGAVWINDITVIRNSTFSGNSSSGHAGALWTQQASTIDNVSFTGNAVTSASKGGGALWANGPITLTNSAFYSNTSAGWAGGAFLQGAFTLSRTIFIANSTASSGGGVMRGSGSGAGLIVNSVFARNSAARGAAIDIDTTNGMVNILFSTIGSQPPALGAAIHITGSASVFITNTIIASHTVGIQQNGGTVVSSDYNLFFGNGSDSAGSVVTGSHSVNGDPAFVDPTNDNYRLLVNSKARNAGVDPGITSDFDGNARPFDGGFDMGAFESQAVNLPPVANAGAPQTVTVGTLVTLTGVASSDPENQALTFGWSQMSGAPVTLDNASAVSPTFSAPGVTGDLVFQLVVTDAFGLPSAPAVVTITVVNGQPSANAGAPQTVNVNSSVTLNGSGSSDPENQPLTFGWSQTSGAPVALSDASATAPTFTAPSTADVLVFQLVVTDSSGLASAPAVVTVTVNALPVTEIPPGDVAITLTTGIARLQPTSDFAATLITGTEPITFVWDFGDGSPLFYGPVASHVYAPGTYTATLTATNSAGTVTSTIRVFVPYRLLLSIIVRDAALPFWQQR